MDLATFAKTPITFDYPRPDKAQCMALAKMDECVEITENHSMILGHDYFQQNLPGSIDRVFCRQSVLTRLMDLNHFLLSEGLSLYLFDVFRTKATQAYLFTEFQKKIQKAHPDLKGEALEIETRKYVSHPDEPTRFTAPPHNTGGAIDLCLVDLKDHKHVNFGSAIDLSNEISATDYFEKPYDKDSGLTQSQWLEAQKNRRILFHCMITLGFTNYPTEWWHYDLGDGMWAESLGLETIYHSMEIQVQAEIEHGKSFA